ncbi:Hypothetical protein A7982_09129 [Minicystis rosea]|nr:Hypothetical protein A7982_09129 [Minicystis rosea]
MAVRVRALPKVRRYVAMSVAFFAVSALPARDSQASPGQQPVADPEAPPFAVRPPPPPAPRYTPYVDRGMSLPWPYAYGALGTSSTMREGERTIVDGSLGGGIGLTKRLWVDASSGTLKMTPEVGYHSPQIGLNAQLLDTPAFELDATTHVTFASEDGRTVEQVEPGLFSVLHVAHKLRIDNGLYVGINPGEKTTVGLRAPVGIGFQITPRVHAVINTGVNISDLGDARCTTVIPMGLSLGWSTRIGPGANAPSIGILPTFSFPELIKPGADDVIQLGYATAGITFVYVSKL